MAAKSKTLALRASTTATVSPRKTLAKSPEPPASRTQVERREESDARMIRAGIKLIAKNGVAGTTLADIGVTAGYSRGLPVYAFGTKDKFLIALLKSMEVWFEKHLRGQLAGKKGLEAVRARLKTHLFSLKRDPVAIAALYSLFSESFFGNESLRIEVERFVGQWRRGFARHLEEAYKAGEIDRIDFEKHGAIYVALVRGVSLEYLMGNRKLDIDEFESAILNFVDHSLGVA
jgi:AcrR family transcriptional regulator